MTKEKYIFLYDDGTVSISTKKLSRLEALETADEFSSYGCTGSLPLSQAIKMSKSIIKLAK